jgi:asparaginyl-tRNA synthetase
MISEMTAPLTTIAKLAEFEGQTITLRGWLYNLRASGKLLFPIFRDGTGTVQGIVPKAAVPEPGRCGRMRGHRRDSSWMLRMWR